MSISQRSLKLIGVSTEISSRWMTELQAPHRHYHTLGHIASIINTYSDMDGDDVAILAAAWLHDIRYDATRNDNEEVSAEIARNDLIGTKVDIPHVIDIILDTKYHQGGSPTLDLFSDLDLMILGAKNIVYRDYMRDIRREYSHVPLADYTIGRAAVLRKFDERQIFKTSRFADLEKAAHRNLQMEIELLEHDPDLIEVIPK